jgi:hypothetical protein
MVFRPEFFPKAIAKNADFRYNEGRKNQEPGKASGKRGPQWKKAQSGI